MFITLFISAYRWTLSWAGWIQSESFFPLFGLEWNLVHCYWGHCWAICNSPGWWWMMNECGAIGGLLGRGKQSARRKSAPVPPCPPEISHDLTRAPSWTVAVGSQGLTELWHSQSKSYYPVLLFYVSKGVSSFQLFQLKFSTHFP
jgi:hypothetical protein